MWAQSTFVSPDQLRILLRIQNPSDSTSELLVPRIRDRVVISAVSFDSYIAENFFQKTLDFICFLPHPTGILRTYVLT